MRPRPRCRALGGSVAVRMCKRQRGGTPMLQLFWFGRRLFQQLCEGSEASAGLGTRLAARLLLGIGIAIGLLLFPNPTNAATDVGGTISADTVWTQAASPFVVSSNITVSSGVTLTIEPGVIVKLSGTQIFVQGTLRADAQGAAPITFTSLKDDSAGGDTNGDGNATSPAPGDWGGLFLDVPSTNNLLRPVVVRYAGTQVTVQTSG